MAVCHDPQAGQLPEHVRSELDAFQRWGTTRFFGAQADPVQPVTMQKYCDHLRYTWLQPAVQTPQQCSLHSVYSACHALPTGIDLNGPGGCLGGS